MINFRKLTLENIIELLNNTGIITTSRDLEYADNEGLFKYVGCKNGSAQYILAIEDDERDGWFYVSRVHVTIGNDKLQADYGGAPEFESRDEAAIAAYVQRTCQ